MNAFFKMSDEVLDTPCAIELSRGAHPRDNMGPTRMLLYIRILVSALSPSKQFVNAEALALFMGAPQKQAEIVWNVCREHGVLRMAEYGFTARAWMVENGYLGRSKADIDKAFDEGVYGKD